MQLLNIGWPEILLIVLIVLLLFGAKKIPELMKSMGKGVKSFKDGMNSKDDDLDELNKKRENKE
jgi:sec-independent protein translocase protein TatA